MSDQIVDANKIPRVKEAIDHLNSVLEYADVKARESILILIDAVNCGPEPFVTHNFILQDQMRKLQAELENARVLLQNEQVAAADLDAERAMLQVQLREQKEKCNADLLGWADRVAKVDAIVQQLREQHQAEIARINARYERLRKSVAAAFKLTI